MFISQLKAQLLFSFVIEHVWKPLTYLLFIVCLKSAGKFCSEAAFTYHVLARNASCQPVFGSTHSPVQPMDTLLRAALNASKVNSKLASKIDKLAGPNIDSKIVKAYTIGSDMWMTIYGDIRYSPGEFFLSRTLETMNVSVAVLKKRREQRQKELKTQSSSQDGSPPKTAQTTENKSLNKKHTPTKQNKRKHPPDRSKRSGNSAADDDDDARLENESGVGSGGDDDVIISAYR